MKDRELECLECGLGVESFLQECPECGASEFKSEPQGPDPNENGTTLEDSLARMTRHVNPLSPA